MGLIDLDGEAWIPTRKLAVKLGITDNRIRQLEDDGYLTSKTESGKKKFELWDSILLYIKYKENHPAANIPFPMMDDDARRLKADADLKEAKAAIENLKKAELEATMHRAEDVEAVITDLAATVRGELLALPGTLAVDMANAQTAAEASAMIKNAVNMILNRLSDYSYDKNEFKKRVREREKWMNAQENSDWRPYILFIC